MSRRMIFQNRGRMSLNEEGVCSQAHRHTSHHHRGRMAPGPPSLRQQRPRARAAILNTFFGNIYAGRFEYHLRRSSMLSLTLSATIVHAPILIHDNYYCWLSRYVLHIRVSLSRSCICPSASIIFAVLYQGSKQPIVSFKQSLSLAKNSLID